MTHVVTSLGNGVISGPRSAMPLPPAEGGAGMPESPGENAEASAPKTGLRAKAARSKTARKIHKVVQRGGSALRRPQKTEWFQTRPDFVEAVYLVEEQGNTYVVSESVAEALGDRCFDGALYGAINLSGDVFLIPVKYTDGLASSSLIDAVEKAEDEWVQSRWVRAEGKYTCDTPDEPVGGPLWPKRTWDDIFDSSVKSAFIDSVEHEVIQRILHAKV